jgi:tetratricopeptide (TPR) repeat protein
MRHRLILIVALLWAAFATAQSNREGVLRELEELIARGSWQSAALVAGPAAVAAFPGDTEAHFLYAVALFHSGSSTEAMSELSQATSAFSDGVPAHHLHLRGLISAQMGAFREGSQLLQAAFVLNPAYDWAMDWGRVAWQAGLVGEAEQAFIAAAQTERGAREAWPHLARGRLLVAQGRYEDAIRAFLTSLHRSETGGLGEPGMPGPAYVEAWFRLGLVYEELGLLEEAENAYRTARSIDPNHGPSVLAVDRLARRDE